MPLHRLTPPQLPAQYLSLPPTPPHPLTHSTTGMCASCGASSRTPSASWLPAGSAPAVAWAPGASWTAALTSCPTTRPSRTS
jgi:hypothetical protein